MTELKRHWLTTQEMDGNGFWTPVQSNYYLCSDVDALLSDLRKNNALLTERAMRTEKAEANAAEWEKAMRDWQATVEKRDAELSERDRREGELRAELELQRECRRVATEGEEHWHTKASAAESELATLRCALSEARESRDKWHRSVEQATPIILAQESELATLRQQVREVVDNMQQAVSARQDAMGPAKGMQVPYHGPLCSAPPSVLKDVTWWAKKLLAALPPLPKEVER